MRSVRRAAGLAGLLLLIVGLVAAPAGAGPRGHGHGSDHGHGHAAAPARIDLPNGWRPEGITTDGKRLYAGSLADGAIWVADPRTGAGRVLAAGTPGRVAVGVDFDRRRDVLWVAGGATGEVRAQDADTGAVLATYLFPSGDSTPRFLNDVVVTRRAVYVTDSSHAELAVIPLSGRALPPATDARLLALTGDLQMASGTNLNGIVKQGRWLVAVQSNAGRLFRIDPRTGATVAVDLHGATVVNGDGLEAARGRLYVVRNLDNLIVPVRLHHHDTRGTVKRALTDAGLDVPSTAARVRNGLYAVNARFTATPTPDTAYWITRVRLPH